MVGREVSRRVTSRNQGIPSLPVFERIAPPALTADLAAEIAARTRPGDIVVDLNGRGGWVARAALLAQRRAIDLESNPLTRLLAEVVLRPPDMRRVDAAAQAVAAGTAGDQTIRQTIDAAYASTCPGCGRAVVLEAVVWEVRRGSYRAIGREYRCPACRDQYGGPDLRRAEPGQGDLALASSVQPTDEIRDRLRRRFPTTRPSRRFADRLLALHTPRQLVCLNAILEQIDGEVRPAPVTAALRLAFLHAIVSASRLQISPGRIAALHIANGSIRMPASHRWRERNPWLAFQDGCRLVRGFVQGLVVGTQAMDIARLGPDLLAMAEGAPNLVLAQANAASLRRLALQGESIGRSGTPSRVSLVLGQAPLSWTPERLAATYHGTAWVFGAEAALLLPLERLFGATAGATADTTADTTAGATADTTADATAGATADTTAGSTSNTDVQALAGSLAVAGAILAPTGRAVVLLESADPETLVAAALGGAAVGCRLVDAGLHRAVEGGPAMAVFVPPHGTMEPGPRTRANRPLPPIAGGAGDAGMIVGQGVFVATEKLDDSPYNPSVAARVVTETAVELLKARGEPASLEHLLGYLLVGLDRSGQLARLARVFRPLHAHEGWAAWLAATETATPALPAAPASPAAPRPIFTRTFATEPIGPVEDLLGQIRAELDRPTNRRLTQVEGGQYWLASEADRAAAAVPLADRVEWAVFGLLSSARQLAESSVFERTAAVFHDSDRPDADLIRACLESYSAPGSTPDAISCSDQLERRSFEHDAAIATIAEVGHRLSMRTWIGRRQQTRLVSGQPLASWLDERERSVSLPSIAWGPQEELERVDCAWYVPRRATFLFEVEWTAMIGEPVLVRHARFRSDEKVVRFLVVPDERCALVRFKLARSEVLSRAFYEGNWHVLTWGHLQAFAGRREISLDDLEPYLGLDASIEAGRQLPLF